MPLQIEFETAGADRGTLRVRGLPEVGSEVLVAVQRLADDRYLTMHGRWDQAASWYPCPRLDGDAAAVRFAAGAALTAGLRAAAPAALRVHLRHRDFTDCGPLEVPGRAPQGVAPGPAQDDAPPLGPGPAATPERHEAEHAADRPAHNTHAQGLPRPLSVTTRKAGRALHETLHETPGSSGISPTVVAITHGGPAGAHLEPTRVRTLGRRAAPALVIVCGGALLWWYLAAQSGGPTPGAMTAGPAGKALFLELKGQDLTPTDLFGHAERVAQAGDCEAAGRLFSAAAKRDPALAHRLGRRYDPADFRPSPCFAAPNPDSAQVWYQHAAAAGIREAQRRYAELLLSEAGAGPVYQDAITWLRKAAAAGDAAAAERLAALKQR